MLDGGPSCTRHQDDGNLKLLKKRRKWVYSSKETGLTLKTFREKRTQTPSRKKWKEFLEEEEEEEEGIELSCGICTERYRERKNRMMISRCGHSLCECCYKTLEKSSGDRPNVKCPSCRAVNSSADYIKCNFNSAKTLVANERKSVTHKLKWVKKNILFRLKRAVDQLLVLESSRAKMFTLPLICTNKQIVKNRTDLLAKLSSTEIRQLLRHVDQAVKQLNLSFTIMTNIIHRP